MKAQLTAIILSSLLAASQAFAKERCGQYLLAGKPGKDGIYLFADTSNETFVRVKGLKLAGKLDRLQADYLVKVLVTKNQGPLPKEARLLKVEGPATTVQQIERGLLQITEKKCSD